MRTELSAPIAYKALASVSLAMSSDPARLNLHCMLVRVDAGRLIICATNGHWLAKYECAAPEGSEPGDLLIGADDVARIVKAQRAERKSMIETHFAEGTVWIGGTTKITLTKLSDDAAFPPYEQVIPKHGTTFVPVCVWSEYLGLAAKAFQVAGIEGVRMETGAKDLDPILFTGDDPSLIAVVMPRRSGVVAPTKPKRARKARAA